MNFAERRRQTPGFSVKSFHRSLLSIVSASADNHTAGAGRSIRAARRVSASSYHEVKSRQPCGLQQKPRRSLACAPNAVAIWNDQREGLTLRAVRPIADDHETTIAYIDGALLKDVRQNMLYEGSGPTATAMRAISPQAFSVNQPSGRPGHYDWRMIWTFCMLVIPWNVHPPKDLSVLTS